jgi:putative oxidoreductase
MTIHLCNTNDLCYTIYSANNEQGDLHERYSGADDPWLRHGDVEGDPMTRGPSARDVGLLALRAGIGGALAAHGVQKLFGWFGGAGLEQTGATFEKLGFRPGTLNAFAAGVGEAGGGALLALGLATPGAAAAAVGTMIVASSMHVDKGFFSSKGGLEYPAVLGLSAAAIALTGPGRLSLDNALGQRLNRSWMRNLALAAAAPAALAVIARRRRSMKAARAAQADTAPEDNAA